MDIKAFIKIVILKCRNLRGNVKIAWSAKVSLSSTFEGLCQVHPHAVFDGHLGMGAYIGPHSRLNAYVGRFTSIAPGVESNNGVHPYTFPFATTSPAFFSLNPRHTQCGSTFATKQMLEELTMVDGYSVKIGNDCWIGQNAFLVGGITIGDGAVVLAHAVVTKDVPPYAIVGGVPAKVIKYRYGEDTIEWLLRIKWWNNTKEWFEKHWELLCDIDKLKSFYTHNPIIPYL